MEPSLTLTTVDDIEKLAAMPPAHLQSLHRICISLPKQHMANFAKISSKLNGLKHLTWKGTRNIDTSSHSPASSQNEVAWIDQFKSVVGASQKSLESIRMDMGDCIYPTHLSEIFEWLMEPQPTEAPGANLKLLSLEGIDSQDFSYESVFSTDFEEISQRMPCLEQLRVGLEAVDLDFVVEELGKLRHLRELDVIVSKNGDVRKFVRDIAQALGSSGGSDGGEEEEGAFPSLEYVRVCNWERTVSEKSLYRVDRQRQKIKLVQVPTVESTMPPPSLFST